MELYSGTSEEFVALTWQNRIADMLEDAYVTHFGRRPARSEKWSWQNSLEALSAILEKERLLDHGIALEYSLPQTSRRLDCMITGLDADEAPHAVVVELKQWSEVQPSDLDECVTTYVGGRLRDVLHPSVQVGRYQQYLADNVAAFSGGDVLLDSCAYLHNKNVAAGGELFARRHTEALDRYPLFCGDQKPAFGSFLADRLSSGRGEGVLSTVRESPLRPARQLMLHVAQMIEDQQVYVLLDEQRVVFQSVLHEAAQRSRRGEKTVILARGGPGTGKSVIALTLLGALLKAGLHARHATGSRAFTGNIRRIVKSRGSELFSYFNSFGQAAPDAIDVLVLDEAHRIRKTSANRFTRADLRPTKPQVDELIQAARVSAFFLDDLQTVRPGEEGSANLIREAAQRNGARLLEYDLEAQFRCNGSEAFINWVDDLLDIRRTANPLWAADDAYEVRMADSAGELMDMVRERAKAGFTARVTAGFCWPWSDPNPDGTLVPDVRLDNWAMPWNAKPDAGRLIGVPPAHLWVSDPRGIDQVGCVYTAQGFEYDYAGVIVGPDLRYDAAAGRWIGDRTRSFDTVVKRAGDGFADLVKHTYRVLLTRGMTGCFLYFADDATREYVAGRMRPAER